MLVKLLDQTYEYQNNSAIIEELFKEINNRLDHSSLFFSHLIIDEKEIYDDFDSYVTEHIDDIKIIEVKAKTIKEFVGDILLSSDDYLTRSLPEIQQLCSDLYQGERADNWEKLLEFIEALDWIHQFIHTLDNVNYHINNFNDYLKIASTLQIEMNALLEAFENKDSLLIADIIQYEFTPVLNDLKKTINETLIEQGYRNDFN